MVRAAQEGLPDAGAGTVLGGVTSYGQLRARHPIDREWPMPETAFVSPGTEGNTTRVFIKIQEGCDAFCTFCIIPFGRGPSRSLPVSDLVERVRELEGQGVKEVVLTGTNLGEYGMNFDPALCFEDLLEALLSQTQIERIRISSLDPSEITPRLLGIMETESRLCPHIHISLQSPDSTILRRMKRNYREDEVNRALFAIAETSKVLERTRDLPGGIFVGMDVIAGFPGETEEIFEKTYNQFRSLPWNRLHVFPYSERQGTAAVRLDGVVPVAERKARVRKLMALSTRRLWEGYQGLVEDGRSLEVLVEGGIDTGQEIPFLSCTTANYLRVLVPFENPALLENKTVWVQPRDLQINERAGDVALFADLDTGAWRQVDNSITLHEAAIPA